MTPDRRCLSHMAPELRPVHVLLERWGAWVVSGQPRQWPERTTLGRVIDEGPGASHQTAPQDAMPREIEPVELAVLSLPHLDRSVVRQEYTHWQPTEVAARRLNVSVSRYTRVLWRARWRVRGYLDAMDASG